MATWLGTLESGFSTVEIWCLIAEIYFSWVALGFWLIPAKHAVDLDRFFILFCAGSSGVDGSTATWPDTIESGLFTIEIWCLIAEIYFS